MITSPHIGGMRGSQLGPDRACLINVPIVPGKGQPQPHAGCRQEELSMPRGKTQRNLDLIDAARAILQDIRPASVRAVCYQLFMRGLIDNMSKGQTDRVSKQLVYAREEGIIPWRWIVNETRSVERVASWNDPEEFMEEKIRWYRKNFWQEQPVRVEVWSEKGTVRGTLDPVLWDYAVDFRVLHGFGSATVVHDVALESLRDPRPLQVLYVGDWDPSGLCMSEVDLPDRVQRYQGNVTITRLALTAEDTRTPGLPSFAAATKSKDSRYRWFVTHYGETCWELDALAPPVLRASRPGAARHHCLGELVSLHDD